MFYATGKNNFPNSDRFRLFIDRWINSLKLNQRFHIYQRYTINSLPIGHLYAFLTSNNTVFMKITIRPLRAFYALTTSAIIFSSCQKNETLNGTGTDAESATIAVAASLSNKTAASGEMDSVYLVQPCERGGKRDSIAASSLPAGVTSYLTANYPGYTFHKAFAIENSSSATTSYAVVIYVNDKPVGLQFDADGDFVKVLEQREKGDLSGPGHHRGGRFEHRDGKGRDSVAFAALSASITSYFSDNYPTDTLVSAIRNHDSSIVVLSKNNAAFATLFSSTGSFIQRAQLGTKSGRCQSIEWSALPATAPNYLSQAYPNYVFEKAFSVTQNGTVRGYVVVIDANNTKYAVEFDSAGSFIGAKTIR